MCILKVLAGFGHRKWPNLAKMSKIAVFRNIGFQGCFSVTNGRRDLGIGSYERSWPVDVHFDSFGHQIVNTPSNRGAVGAFSCFTNTSLSRIGAPDYQIKMSYILPYFRSNLLYFSYISGLNLLYFRPSPIFFGSLVA